MTPSVSLPGATSAETAAPGRRGRTTMGRRTLEQGGFVRRARLRRLFARQARSRAISAKGLSERRLRRRSSATAVSLAASQASRKPPRPLTARMLPARSSARALRMIASESRSAKEHRPAGVPRGDQRERRAADGAGIGLRVEAAVGGVGVLRRAGRAHGEAGHGGGGAVVGDVLDDGVARAAVGAVGEGIAEAAVGGSPKSRQQASQVPASGEISEKAPGSSWLSRIGKLGAAAGCDVGDRNGCDRGKLRGFGAQGVEECGRPRLRGPRSRWSRRTMN